MASPERRAVPPECMPTVPVPWDAYARYSVLLACVCVGVCTFVKYRELNRFSARRQCDGPKTRHVPSSADPARIRDRQG